MALAELEAIRTWQETHWPTSRAGFADRLEHVHHHIEAFPEAAPLVAGRPGVRAAGLTPYPYRLFYRVSHDWIDVLHIRHVARVLPDDDA